MKRILIIMILLLQIIFVFASENDSLNVFEGKKKSPFVATALSIVLPAGGQVYNEKWLKGSLFMGTEFVLGGIAATNYYLNAKGESTDLFGTLNASLSTAKTFTWFFAAVYVYSIMDAYVDANLSAFPSEKFILEPEPKINGVGISYQF